MAETRIQRSDAANRPESTAPERLREVRRLTFPVDIYETDDDMILVADLPGVSRDDLDIRVERHQLTIEGRREQHGETWYYRRAFTLPDTIDADRITAECHHGVLQLTLPRSEHVKPRRIPVRGAESRQASSSG